MAPATLPTRTAARTCSSFSKPSISTVTEPIPRSLRRWRCTTTEWAPRGFLPLKLLGGAFGYGLKRNVLNLYTGLVRIYDPGDQIYSFGSSRGAFTVRTLAGMIARYAASSNGKICVLRTP